MGSIAYLGVRFPSGVLIVPVVEKHCGASGTALAFFVFVLLGEHSGVFIMGLLVEEFLRDQ